MHIYFSGIGGVGIGPLAEIALDAGHQVSGSDLQESPMTKQLRERGVDVQIGQDGSQIAAVHEKHPVDWFVYTAALSAGRPELDFVQAQGIRATKRDELLAEIIAEKDLKLIAVSGTHGKTTTTGMLIWAMQKLGVRPSYSVGATLSFGPSGHFEAGSEYFVYECDEFDRNFLHFSPYVSVITSIDHDHFDTYPTLESYQQAFVQFLQQSEFSVLWEKDLRALGQADVAANYEAYDELMDLTHIHLAGDHVRHNAFLVQKALERLSDASVTVSVEEAVTPAQITSAINSFPGTSRRFEKLADKLYSDYGHHPVEIAATLQMARELSDHVVLVYQPHQNVRQHEVRSQYTDCMELAEKIYWLPTYLSREDPNLDVLSPEQLSENLTNKELVTVADLNDELWRSIQQHLQDGALVLCMGAGSIDGWLREQLTSL